MAFIPNWSPTAYYNINDSVLYLSVEYILTVAGSTPGVFGVPPPSNLAAWDVVSTGVSSLNTLSGALTLAPGNDITIVPSGGNTLTINAANQPISNRSSGSTPTLITQTTSGTAQTFGTANLNTTKVYDINIWITLSVTAGTPAVDVGVRAYAFLNGLQIGGTQSLQLPPNVATHPMTLTFIASSFNVPAGANPFAVKVFATTGSIVTLNQFQIIAIGNLA